MGRTRIVNRRPGNSNVALWLSFDFSDQIRFTRGTTSGFQHMHTMGSMAKFFAESHHFVWRG